MGKGIIKMKFVVLSDIHGNIQALRECIKAIEKMQFDAIIWCGDYITDFSGSHEIIELIQYWSARHNSYIIAGNREQNIIDYANGKEFNIRYKKNLEHTYNLLTKNDIEWIKSLPESLEIELDDNNKIYVSHKCTYENIKNCKYKIFGHSHKQYNFTRDGIKYINPGSVGIPTDESIGAQFITLEITDKYEKIEQYLIKYNYEELLENLKKSPLYNDEIRWGNLIEREVQTGIDYPQKCINEYNKIREEHGIREESLEIWNVAVDNTLNGE